MDKRFLKEEGVAPYTGNELILKGALEGGVALLTGYPGSPVSEVFDAITRVSDLLLEKGIVAQMANNEGLAAARLNGARLAGLRALAVMKSVGMHVAADGLAIGNLAESKKPEGGALVIVGDDPWNETTQINSDSRFLSLHLHMPVIEPATFQELKDWIREAFELSGASDLYLTMVLTTNQADGGGSVQCRPNLYPRLNHHHRATLSSAQLPVDHTVMIPPHTSLREATLASRFERLLDAVRARGLNRVDPASGADRPTVGFVTAGLSYCYLAQALREMGLEGRFPILKFGVTYPLDEALLVDFAAGVDHLVVVEEKRDFLETQVLRALQRARQEGRAPRVPAVWGKKFPDEKEGFPVVRGLNSSIVFEKLHPLLSTLAPAAAAAARATAEPVLALIQDAGRRVVSIPVRTPTFCPGCPHRDSSTVAKALKKDFLNADYMAGEGRDPMDVIFHGESGCHSMLQFEPNVGLMQDYSGMGLGGGTGSGMDPFIKNKQVVFLGDSTFFHSGMVAVSDSIKNNQDITYIILENGTTAMTGHQPTPGSSSDVLAQRTFAQNIEQVVRGLSRDSVPIFRVNPGYQDAYRKLLEDVVLRPGVKIIIADKECGITYQRRVRREKKRVVKEQGYLPEERFINITPEVCETCLECTNATGCPGLAIEDTLHGPKIVTDRSLCVSDGACAKGKVCPSFEEVIVHRRAPTAGKEGTVDETLPSRAAPRLEDTWYCYTAGVGGMGSGVTTGILVQAGLLEGYHVLFADKKGLAIRNGGVYGHVIFSREPKIHAPLVPYGRADLLLGIDLLEAARGLDNRMNLRVASPGRTDAVVNTHKMPTVRTLLGKEDFSVAGLEEAIKAATRGYLGLDFAGVSEAYFGNRLYANVLLLGAAYEKGHLPLSMENLKKAIALMVPVQDREENLRAFDVGRRAAARPEEFSAFSPRLPGYWEVLEDRAQLLRASRPLRGRAWSRDYRRVMDEASRWMDLPEADRARMAQYVYDLIQWGGPSYARRYLTRLWAVYKKDTPARGHRATRAVLDNLARVMAIKDEVYVAHLLTSPEKRRRDRSRYNIDESRGDRLEYVHLNRPRFTLFGRDIQFDWRSRDWQLMVMKRLGVLRRLLPAWHRREREFLEWYEGVVDGFNLFTDDGAYDLYVEALSAPAEAKGYREIRYPKMDAVRSRVEELRARWNARVPAGAARSAQK
ncbi:MAG: 2-oxoacid:acceptor oxidoreductase family protein [Elusimicrobia bacterium]|nr:2-oxoacid:acceptor oxidoreductase family protein [Elusimicrobiota bacterium]MBK7544931.1 2-oxoacid:acceptor oxidoreductase family protein [Elusimicrobiota bacterium]MBK7574447.1 2-oxoacid:acceptor oxidoreductase family protein [Elusimicrobiota bacterium]MBK7688187.1 2-oxoacid:acceptor oxidoreductase family protein [Elusimicrobiota bacterium]MBK9057475.1 2-oxoacid:acceptor oxidoreductase family protein [Elusimicrobiota bacterium]